MRVSELNVAVVENALEGTRFHGRLRYFPSVGSTNTLALEAAQAGAREGVWIADEQTAGRGRGGHGWHSAAGDGVYVSALVEPRVPAQHAMWISLATSLAVRQAIAEASGLTADIRWPNDLLLRGRKCAGILVESALPAARGQGMRYAVIGVGVNVNHESFPQELQEVATSLRMEAGREIVRERLLSSLLLGMDAELGRLQAGEAGVLERFAAASSWVMGKVVRVGEGDGYTGVTAGLDPSGFLRVRDDSGGERLVLSGGVRELN